MKFFLECVGCCLLSTTPPLPSTGSDHTSLTSAPKSEETRSLMASNKRRRKRTSGAEWRPSLYAISEDNAIMAVPEILNQRKHSATGPVRAAAQRNVKRCGQSSARVTAARSHARDFSYSNDPLPIAVPTFSAAPFMF